MGYIVRLSKEKRKGGRGERRERDGGGVKSECTCGRAKAGWADGWMGWPWP